MKTKLVFLLIGTCCLLLPVYSQVTVGSGLEPRKGSLLELKENNEAGANSTKGFSLPRVKLNAPTELTLDDDSKGEEYKGLTVQNTTTTGGLIEGIYCWDGKMWKLVVAVNGQGTDGQILTSKGTGMAPEWKSEAELNVPTVDLIANAIPTANPSTYPPAGFRAVGYDIAYMKGFKYVAADSVFTPDKSAYYQVSLYNKLDVKPDWVGEYDDNGGTARTALSKRTGVKGNYQYEDLISFNAFYYAGSTYVLHPLTGLVLFEKDQNYVVRTTYTREFIVTGGRISFTHVADE